ncbi:hypothetical protein LS482_16125 [Sinomicrobium kalidii]|uniref:hypothetical protein n=1 Tax=Sinomicrobium kalidii TaxID=2900738 RepID=UPI001E2986F7|nr:hypothetical protein [Sinomicrobium kalidii]UGU15200.1 hypothetical protein LS482_16125 [Sinomicrobium kalidii]
MARKTSTRQFYNDIRREYHRLSLPEKDGVRTYTDERIFQQLAKKYYRSPRTIENIVFHRVSE